jgi:uncharacterized delta-60 repeat protein
MLTANLPIRNAIIAFWLLTFAFSLRAQTIQLDNSFGTGGKFTVDFAESGLRSSHAYSVALQPSGRIVVFGGQITGGQFGTASIATCGLTSGGVLDGGFGTAGKTLDMVNSEVRAIEPLPSGQVLRLIHSYASQSSTSILQRVNLNGFVDNSFAADLNVGAQASPVSVKARPDGRILVLLRGIGGDDSHWLVRLNANGSRDTSFGNNGVLLLNMGRLSRSAVIGLHPIDGDRVLLGGYLNTNHGPSGGNVVWAALLDGNGHLDRRFGLQGIFRMQFPFGLRIAKTLVQPDGKFVLIGNGRPVTTSQFLLVRLTRRGRPDVAFGQNGVAFGPNLSPGSHEVGYSGGLMSDGRIVVVGSHAATQTSPSSFAVGRFSAAGILESSAVTPFTPDQSSVPHDVLIQPDGKIVVAGYTRNPDASADGNLFAIARYTQQ